MKPKFEFILIGVGLNNNTDRGTVCDPIPEPPDICPKGAPTFRNDEGPEAEAYAEDGYITIQGPGKPEVLGGSRFESEADAKKWLAGRDGERFKQIFLNVFLARVIAQDQPQA